MAISPPTDIVLDVLNNADPARLEVAQAKLKAGHAAAEAQRLLSTDGSFETALNTNAVADANKLKHRLDGPEKKHVPEAYKKFEAMVLQNFVKTMLPDNDEVYGKGATGEIWKGMMAEQIANEIAKGKGIGIAEKLMDHGNTKVNEKTDKAEKAENNRSDRMHMATQLIDQNQLKVLDKFLPGDHAGKDS